MMNSYSGPQEALVLVKEETLVKQNGQYNGKDAQVLAQVLPAFLRGSESGCEKLDTIREVSTEK